MATVKYIGEHGGLINDAVKARNNNMTYGQWQAQEENKYKGASQVPEGYRRVADILHEKKVNSSY